MKGFTLAILAASATAMSEIESAFLGFITQYGKSYKSMEEYEQRLRNFAVTHAQIQQHSQEEGHTYTVAHNAMSDWSEEEWAKILTYKAAEPEEHEISYEQIDGATPIDWRTGNCIWPILNQEQCGSCWTFSTQSSMSANYCIMLGGPLENFST